MIPNNPNAPNWQLSKACTCGVMTGGLTDRNPRCEIHGDHVPPVQIVTITTGTQTKP